jgi:hypothetical protein
MRERWFLLKIRPGVLAPARGISELLEIDSRDGTRYPTGVRAVDGLMLDEREERR